MSNTTVIMDALNTIDQRLEARSYSGRFMFGKTCLAIGCPDDAPAAEVALRLIHELHCMSEIEVAEVVATARTRTDSLGLGTILYFPDLPFEDPGTDADEEIVPDYPHDTSF